MKKRITHIVDGLHLGGAERIVQSIAIATKDDFDIEVITLSSDPIEGQEIALELIDAGVSVVQIKKKSKWGGAAFLQLVQYLQRTNPDIVHTHLFAADIWGARAAYRASVPTIISTEHNINNDEGLFKHWLKSRTNHVRDAIVAISQSVEQYIVEIAPDIEKRICLIPNGIDYARFAPVAAQRSWKSDSVLQIAVVGRLAEQKGQKELLESLSKMDSEVSYHVTMVGEGPERGEIIRLISEYNLQDSITLLPATEEIEDIYEKADIVIVPSLWEGFGLVAIEAMAAGSIVIASNVDGLADAIEHKKTGFLIDPFDSQLLQETLQLIQSDSALRERMRAEAQDAIQKRFTQEVMNERYTALYESHMNNEV